MKKRIRMKRVKRAVRKMDVFLSAFCAEQEAWRERMKAAGILQPDMLTYID